MDPFYMTNLIICKFDNSLEPPGKFMDQVSDVNLLVSFEMGPKGIFKISHRVCKKFNEAHSELNFNISHKIAQLAIYEYKTKQS